MNNCISARILSFLLLLLTLSTHTTANAEQFEGSKTIIAGSNSALLRGAAALKEGRAEEGIRLTLEGLKDGSTVQDRAVGHSNACAGYRMLKQWAEALAHCNAALALDMSNWQTYNNRAGIYIAQGLFALGLQDLRAALALAPKEKLLQESMRILERDRLLSSRQARTELTS
jgi:tetratricopeptide (TPR) repeat protein